MQMCNEILADVIRRMLQLPIRYAHVAILSEPTSYARTYAGEIRGVCGLVYVGAGRT